MNKLIITGNGFDLAHKLPTSYADLIKWFWNNICKNFEKKLFSNLYYFNPKFKSRFEHIESLDNSSEIIHKVINGENCDGKINVNHSDSFLLQIGKEDFCKYNNSFFKYINETLNSNVYWVYIEMCYYKMLTDIRLRSDNSIRNIIDLNNQFEQVKNLFEYYLEDVVLPMINSDEFLNTEIQQLFLPEIGGTSYITLNNEKYFSEFNLKYLDELKENVQNVTLFNNMQTRNEANFDKLPKLLFLDFNYTNTIECYEKKIYNELYSDIKTIKIHGEISNDSNPINFGFGDEMDAQYKVLENYNDNEYLKNIKSFHYFYNQNYRDLMNWIELGNYQIIIMGHSCGLSDRTLLNTLFEHEKCASIKFFYYKNETGDNYIDIVQNISRHFNDKKVMRNKIVNKSLTKPLPQNRYN